MDGRGTIETSARLDIYIIALFNRDMIGYILLYKGRRTTPKQMSEWKTLIMQWVLQKRDVPSDRIKLVDGGYRTDPEIELFLITKELSPPSLEQPGLPIGDQ